MGIFDMVFVRLQNTLAAVDEESGQTLIEYALIVSLIAIGTIGALFFFGDAIRGLFTDTANSLPS